MATAPIPESVYEAAVRYIARDAKPDDGGILERWHAAEVSRTTREIALEAIKQASERGIARVCRG